MSYVVIFDFIIKSAACLFGIVFCLYLLINEIKQEKRNRQIIRRLREIEKQCDKSCNVDKNTKEFVNACVDAMEELLKCNKNFTIMKYKLTDETMTAGVRLCAGVRQCRNRECKRLSGFQE